MQDLLVILNFKKKTLKCKIRMSARGYVWMAEESRGVTCLTFVILGVLAGRCRCSRLALNHKVQKYKCHTVSDFPQHGNSKSIN